MPRRPDPVDPTTSPAALFGAALRQWRNTFGGSLPSVAEEINSDFSVLGRWERGERLPPIEAVERLDRLYRAGGFLTSLHGLVYAAKTRSVPLAGTSAVPDPVVMDSARRRLLLGAATAGVSAALLPGLEQLRTIVDDRLGGPDLDAWEDIAWEHAHSITLRPLAQVIGDLSVDLLNLHQVLASVPSREAASWARVNARLTFLLALVLGIAGHARESRDWWTSARRAAAQTGDDEFVAAAYAYEAVQALYEGRPLALVVSRADKALALTVDRPGRAAAEAFGARAHALALMGDHAGARASVDQQADVFATLHESVTGDETLEGWAELRLLHTRSLVLTLTGDSAAASAQQEALRSYPPNHKRQIAQIRLHQATSAVLDGDVIEGLNHAAAIVGSIAPEDMSPFVLHVARGVANAAPPDHKAQPAISAYRERLSLTAAKEDS
ncbi:helix-turn-helix transcriptional regulator [Streptosporangium sp. NPDC002524]|uniref:helix-turn-helix domain-containing protein n=1 Tax=Streptosporangium sp. NPDC002524 TaxID=3154537 RepID=UPI003318FB4E